MATLQPPRGTNDLVAPAATEFAQLEALAAEVFERAGYGRIITPMFEDTALFHRGIGSESEVVTKETYDFTDRSGNPLTLRPEGTASAMRAIVTARMWDEGLPIKVFYSAAMFRYERPQKGRVRQHHQVGLEGVGTDEASFDADVIGLGLEFLSRAKAGRVTLLLNSMGHSGCRSKYIEKLKEHLAPAKTKLSEDSQRRLEVNPLRIWDSKAEADIQIMAQAPTLAESLCGQCADHFAAVRGHLDDWGIAYEITPGLVRGFDYYTRTTFEFRGDDLEAAQNAVGGGGRYDGLVSSIGGPDLQGIGFGIGLERLMLAREAAGNALSSKGLACLVIALREDDVSAGMALVRAMRQAGVSSDLAHVHRGIKAQMKYANKIGAKNVALIGESESLAGTVTLKDMDSGEQRTIPQEVAIASLSPKENQST